MGATWSRWSLGRRRTFSDPLPTIRRPHPAAFAAWGVLLALIGGVACGSEPVDIVGADDILCVRESAGRHYCFGDGLADDTPFFLPTAFDGTQLVLGASICGKVSDGHVRCMERWDRADHIRTEPFASQFEEWLQLPSELLESNAADASRPLRICGRTSTGMECGPLTGASEPAQQRSISIEPLHGLVFHGFEICGITGKGEVLCFHPLHDSIGERVVSGSRRLFGGDHWLCAETDSSDVTCFPVTYVRDRSKAPVVAWTVPKHSNRIVSIRSAGLHEICVHYDDGSLECHGMTRDARGIPSAESLTDRPSRVRAVATEGGSICAVTVDDQVICWRSGATASSDPDERPHEVGRPGWRW